MSWSPQQEAAIKAVRNWLNDPSAPQVFRLFGFAGTGKTTLAKTLAEDVPGTLFAAYTGKASLVLRKKGCRGAQTIHSLIYKPEQDESTGKVTFKLNLDSQLSSAPLLVVDEVSMVGDKEGQDLLSFGVKLLVLGDPAQLPPVKGEGFFINAQPDFLLTEVHRQAAENPIIRMSMDVREGRGLKPGRYGACEVVSRSSIAREELAHRVLQADQLLCGMNATRQAFNMRTRELKGLRGSAADWHPAPGDKLICIKNDRMAGLLNGGLWTVEAATQNGGDIAASVSSLDEPGVKLMVSVPWQFFLGREAELNWRDRRDADEFTYGWAMTVHKSQGSQWDNVIVYDESRVFRDSARNHLYTAITRAAEQVTIVQT